jgi:hypothetical protein
MSGDVERVAAELADVAHHWDSEAPGTLWQAQAQVLLAPGGVVAGMVAEAYQAGYGAALSKSEVDTARRRAAAMALSDAADDWRDEGRGVMFNRARDNLTPEGRVGKWLRNRAALAAEPAENGPQSPAAGIAGSGAGGSTFGDESGAEGDSERPRWVDLFGADPDYCGGQDVNEWLDEQRGDA